jgi:hypothetical protein
MTTPKKLVKDVLIVALFAAVFVVVGILWILLMGDI